MPRRPVFLRFLNIGSGHLQINYLDVLLGHLRQFMVYVKLVKLRRKLLALAVHYLSLLRQAEPAEMAIAVTLILVFGLRPLPPAGLNRPSAGPIGNGVDAGSHFAEERPLVVDCAAPSLRHPAMVNQVVGGFLVADLAHGERARLVLASGKLFGRMDVDL